MNDALLIKALRAWDGTHFDEDAHKAADRIEELERDYKEACNEAADCYTKQCVAEARLAKAIKALRNIANAYDINWHAGVLSRAVLAKLEAKDG
jgi:cell division septum initiation protein DivIVA